MLSGNDEIIKFILDKNLERFNALLGLEMSVYEQEMQHNIFLGVEMVINWIKNHSEEIIVKDL